MGQADDYRERICTPGRSTTREYVRLQFPNLSGCIPHTQAQTFYSRRRFAPAMQYPFGVLIAGRLGGNNAAFRSAALRRALRVRSRPAHKLGSLPLAEIKGWSSTASQRLSASHASL
jgi:hypothetical protein